MILLVLAAGLSSRYGSLKQFDNIGPKGETIIELTIREAVQVGFKKAVFVIREENLEQFKCSIVNKIKDLIEIEYVYQNIDDIPIDNKNIKEERKKPWGTAHAVLAARDKIDDQFLIVNSDDYYGKDVLEKAYSISSIECKDNEYYMIGFKVIDTLSKSGGVSRALCTIDSEGILNEIHEKNNITIHNNIITYKNTNDFLELDKNSIVSMNLWIFNKGVFLDLKEGFKKFILENKENKNSEFLIQDHINRMIKQRKIRVKVLIANGTWCGVTYIEDRNSIKEKLIKKKNM